METHNIMSFKAILLLLLFSIVLAKADLDSSTILKTIVSGNETIDCVDIYRQPAFNHPLLKDHVIQLEPSSYPDETKSRVPRELTQLWHKNGEYCPNGTVPILRSPTNIPPENNTSDVVPNANFPFSKFAAVFLVEQYYRGASADIGVWRPRVGTSEVSTANIRVGDGFNERIEAGWQVGPGWFEIEHPVLYAYWTSDNDKTTGCYNTECPGFVHVNTKYALGGIISPESTYGGKQYEINLRIYKDFKTSHWWLLTGRTGIGYWPARLVKNLSKKNIVRQLEYGGKVTKSKDNTIVEMGNGHFPGEGFGKAAFFFNLEYVDGKNYWSKVPDDVFVYVSRPDCYDLKMQNWDVDYGTSFLYGGPGTACRRKDDSPERSAAAAVGAVGV